MSKDPMQIKDNIDDLIKLQPLFKRVLGELKLSDKVCLEDGVIGFVSRINPPKDGGYVYIVWTAGGGAIGSLSACAFWTFDGRGQNWKFMGAP